MKAVVMCGGIGSRLKPLTETVPKPLIKILNRPVLDIVIEKLIDSGIDDISLSLGFMSDEIIDYVNRRNYNAKISFCVERKPLGTAGGVKNCIKKSDENILVVSGDNLFDFDLKKISDFHCESNADITVCAYKVNDPREYGVILTDDDDEIVSFIEKPSWEQVKSFMINTGIYILDGSILDMIPENEFYDFANDLFPVMFMKDMRFMCCKCKGYWGDMGEFTAMHEVTADILSGKFNNFKFEGTLYKNDIQFDNGVRIIAPSLIGENVKLDKNCEISAYTVIGDNCVIGKECSVNRSIIGEGTVIGENCDIKNSVIGDNVLIEDNCCVDDKTVLAYGCNIGRFSRILHSSKIWPGRNIAAESVISKDMFYESPERIEFDVFGLSGKMNNVLSLSDAAKIGHSVASISDIKKAGIGFDGKICTSGFKDVCAAGMKNCGVTVYDFGEMVKVQSYFYSVYCSLDAFIYVSSDGDIINFSFSGKNGMPVTSSVARTINNNYRFSSFNFAKPENYHEIFNMSLFSAVYKSYFNKMMGNKNNPFTVITETDNVLLKELLDGIFNNDKYPSERILQILINNSGSELYFIENENYYSSQRVHALLCELEFADGNNVIIPEDAPAVIEEKAEFYGQKAFRVFENDNPNHSFSAEKIMNNLWSFDPVMMIARIINVMTESMQTLEQLLHYQDDFTMRKNIIELDVDAGRIRERILASGASRKDNDSYYTILNRKGRARIRQIGNSSRVRILSEAYDMETAKELTAFVTEKIKNSYIDKDMQK